MHTTVLVFPNCITVGTYLKKPKSPFLSTLTNLTRFLVWLLFGNSILDLILNYMGFHSYQLPVILSLWVKILVVKLRWRKYRHCDSRS